MKNVERMRRIEGSPERLSFLMGIRDIGGESTNKKVKEAREMISPPRYIHRSILSPHIFLNQVLISGTFKNY